MVWRQGKEREGGGKEEASGTGFGSAAGGGSGHRRQRGEVGKRWRGVAPESRVEESEEEALVSCLYYEVHLVTGNCLGFPPFIIHPFAASAASHSASTAAAAS